MERKITDRDLKQIRKDVEGLTVQFNEGGILFVTIILPERADKETVYYANMLCTRLAKVNCFGRVSQELFYSLKEASDKNYEVMKDFPLATPCIRVYPKKAATKESIFERTRRAVRHWWDRLMFSDKNEISPAN